MVKRKRSQALGLLTNPTLGKNESFCARLREARERRGWTIEYTSEVSGVSASTIKKLEKGETSVAWGFVLVLLQIYGLISELDGLCHASKDVLAPVPQTHSKSPSTVIFDDDLA